ncbi:MAG TPA: hypothetical protein VH186_23055 [Chloroflexia bacterium]|nr:hypothetical protein [Chloroflexia bacterium]
MPGSPAKPKPDDTASEKIDPCSPCSADALLQPGSATVHSEDPEELARSLASRYPLTIEAFRSMEGGLVHLGYILALQERWQRVARGEAPTESEVLRYLPASQLPATDTDFDVVYCGGVLGLFSAAVLARQGYKVAVLDQRRVGTSHREWNISDEELQRFVEAGLFSVEELERAVSNRYKKGLVRFYSRDIPEQPADLYLDHVLDVAMDLGKLLEMARARFEEAGGVTLDFRALKTVKISESGPVRAVVEATNREGQLERFGARLVVNALGSISPLSLVLQDGKPFDGVCPTVGTTARGFVSGTGELEVNPEIGDVLLSVAHAQKGRQLIWEGFPGHGDEMTVYVFYYDLVKPELAAKQSLLDLFEDYFELLSTYKAPGENFAHLKPVYGFIPARHHRAEWGSASRRGIISVGDATSPQSSLTFCGFGSQVRNLPRLTRLLAFALDHDLLEKEHLRQIGAHQSNISLVWVFSRFMQPANARQHPDDVNRMMNVFCAGLNECGPELTRRFFQDRFGWLDYNRLTLMTAFRAPRVFPFTFEVMGMRGVGHWAFDYLKFSREALFRTIYKIFPGRKFGMRFERWLAKKRPDLALALAARREEWDASGLL